MGRKIALFIYRYAWGVHLVLMPTLYVMAFIDVSASVVPSTCVCLALLGLPVVLIGRVVANKLTVLDDPKSYDAVKVYCVGMLLQFAFWLLVGIANKFMG